jgi:hypothetical protein
MKQDLKTFVHDGGKPLTEPAQITNNINHDVEKGGINTVAGLVSKYGDTPKLRRNIGRGINERRWHIDGVLPNNSGKRQTDKAGAAANEELGSMVITQHASKTITVLGERPRRSQVEH